MPLTLVQTVPPTAEPVDLAEAKAHSRIEVADEDALIAAWIKAARNYAEVTTGRQLVAATWRLNLDAFPGGWDQAIRLPKPPLVSVSSVKYLDTSGTQQTLATTEYTVDAAGEPARITPAYGKIWPSTRAQVNAVEVVYVAGYAAPFAAAAATDLLTVSGRTFTNGDVVRVTNSGGALPEPLEPDTDYYVRDVSGSTLKLAATAGGSAINLTTDGSGTHFLGEVPAGIKAAVKLLVGHWNENREASAQGAFSALPMAVDSLLMQHWYGSY